MLLADDGIEISLDTARTTSACATLPRGLVSRPQAHQFVFARNFVGIEEAARSAVASQRSVGKIPIAINHDVGYAIRDKSGQVAAALACDDLYYYNPRLAALAHLGQP